MSTIFAQATAPGRAGISVVRVSGIKAFDVAQELAGRLERRGGRTLRKIVGPDGDLIDEALLLLFPGPKSFTGEDVVEFHMHGSVAVVKKLLAALGTFPEVRFAEPGEFTRRALENDRLDLTQVEGLSDLIEAETELQHKQALAAFSGGFGDLVEDWRAQLIRAAALIEATIDFADEDVPVDVSPEVQALLHQVTEGLMMEVEGSKSAERIRCGFQVAIVGAPNLGKSTLLNALAGRDAAITSSVAGTTRDVIEVRMDLEGLPVTLIDTAGLRETGDVVEREGVARALARARDADLRVVLVDGDEPSALELRSDDIVLRAKADLLDDKEGAVSGLTGVGVGQLVQRVHAALEDRVAHAGLASRERHRIAMTRALGHLEKVSDLIREPEDHSDLVAAELRFALHALEVMVGRVDVEHLLDEIFASFCLGK